MMFRCWQVCCGAVSRRHQGTLCAAFKVGWLVMCGLGSSLQHALLDGACLSCYAGNPFPGWWPAAQQLAATFCCHACADALLCAYVLLYLQETGICRPDCPFAHNINSLQLPLEPIQQKLVAALGKGPGTRLSAAALRAAEGGSGGGAASSSAAVGCGGGRAGEWDFAQAGAPAKSRDGGSVTSSGPASATAASTPASAAARWASGPASDNGSGVPAAAARASRQRLEARHQARLAGLLGNRGRPQHLRPCK